MKVLVVCMMVLCVASYGFAGYIEGKTPSEGKAPSCSQCYETTNCGTVNTASLWPWNWTWDRFVTNAVHYPFDIVNRTLEVPASLCPCNKPCGAY